MRKGNGGKERDIDAEKDSLVVVFVRGVVIVFIVVVFIIIIIIVVIVVVVDVEISFKGE